MQTGYLCKIIWIGGLGFLRFGGIGYSGSVGLREKIRIPQRLGEKLDALVEGDYFVQKLLSGLKFVGRHSYAPTTDSDSWATSGVDCFCS